MAVSALATLLFVAAFLSGGIGSPLTWAAIAVWIITDLALLSAVLDRGRALRRERDVQSVHPAAPARPADTTVVLLGIGENKIGAIKALRGGLALGLREAKNLADAAEKGAVALEPALDRATAERLVSDLLAAGARAEVQSEDGPVTRR